MICMICGKTYAYYFSKNNFRILRCPGCALMRVENIPDDLSKYYSAGYFTGDTSLDGYMDYESDKEASRTTYERDLRKISSNIFTKASKKMFEVGAATGFFLRLARSKGWVVKGIDISGYAAEMAKKNGIDVTAASFDDYLSSDTYDVVVMYDVIEHVKNPESVVVKAREMLNQGGLLAIATPDAGSLWARLLGKRWYAFVPPQHLFYFNKKNLSEVLQKNGFKVVYSGSHGKRFTIPYILRLLYSWTRWRIWSGLAGLAARSFLKNFSIPINLGDNLFIVVRKQ